MWRWLLALVALAALAAGIGLGALNPQTVSIDLAFASFAAPLGGALVASLVTGIAVGVVVGAAGMLVMRRRRRT